MTITRKPQKNQNNFIDDKETSKKVQISLTINKDLLQRLDATVNIKGISRSAGISYAISSFCDELSSHK